jgi:hypothetical protein
VSLAVAAVGVLIDEIFHVHVAAGFVTLAVVVGAVRRRRQADKRPGDPKD